MTPVVENEQVDVSNSNDRYHDNTTECLEEESFDNTVERLEEEMVDETETPSSMDDENVIVQPRINQIVDETGQIIQDSFRPGPNYPFIKSKD